MVSLGQDRVSGGGYSFCSADNVPLFDEVDEASLVSSVLVTDEQKNEHKMLPVTGVISLEILCTISIFVSAFVVPFYSTDNACFILSCAHAGFWALLFITSSYRNYHHNFLQRSGYLEFTRNTQLLQRIPLIVPSLGNTILVINLALFLKYCPHPETCKSSETSLKCYNYLQILIGLEAVILLNCFVKYLVLVIRFNRSKLSPDVNQEELLIGYMQSYAPTNEIGFRDEDYMEEVLEKQADMIRYLKQHSNNLSRKIMKLSSQLEGLQNPTQRF